MFTRNVPLIASIVVVIALLASAASHAGPMPLTRINSLTFSEPVALPGVTLGAGTYVFEAGPGGTNPNVVRVLSQNRQKLFYLGFTIVVPRPAGRADQVLAFGESAPGEATPIVAWYPIGSDHGHEFLYR